jgi:hypothetical protein
MQLEEKPSFISVKEPYKQLIEIPNPLEIIVEQNNLE